MFSNSNIFGATGQTPQQKRDNEAINTIEKPRTAASSMTDAQRKVSLANLKDSVVSRNTFLKPVKSDATVQTEFARLHFYCPQGLNYFVCSDCDKGGKLVSDPREGGLNTLIDLHNKQQPAGSTCIKPKAVEVHTPSSLYMPAQQAPQAALYHQNPPAMPMQGSSYPQPPYQGFHQPHTYHRP